MLAGQNLCRRHYRNLHLVRNGQQGGVKRHDRLARAYVTLQKPIHRLRLVHISSNFRDTRVLVFGEQKRKSPADSAVDLVGAAARHRL